MKIDLQNDFTITLWKLTCKTTLQFVEIDLQNDFTFTLSEVRVLLDCHGHPRHCAGTALARAVHNFQLDLTGFSKPEIFSKSFRSTRWERYVNLLHSFSHCLFTIQIISFSRFGLQAMGWSDLHTNRHQVFASVEDMTFNLVSFLSFPAIIGQSPLSP